MQEGKLVSEWRKFVCKERLDEGFEPKTGDWADYELCRPYVCCAWMGLHDDVDYGATPQQPYFWLRARFWHPGGSLVVADDATGRLKIVSRTAKVIRFDGTKLHGFMPHHVAQEVVDRQDDQGPLYNALEQRLRRAEMAPKLVWQWLDAEGRVKP